MMIVFYLILGVLIYFIVKDDEKNNLNRSKEKCINCGKEVEHQFLYCPYCKENLKKKCESCGKLIESNWRYCPFCGDNEVINKLCDK